MSLSPALAPDLTPASIHLSYIPNQSFRPKTHSQGRCINKARSVWHTHINTHTCRRNPDLCVFLLWHKWSIWSKQTSKYTHLALFIQRAKFTFETFSRNKSTFILNQAFSTSFYFQKPIQYFREMHSSHLFQISRGRTQTGIPIIRPRWTAEEIRNLLFHHFPQAKKKKRFKTQCWGAINANSVLSWVMLDIFTYILSSIIVSIESEGDWGKKMCSLLLFVSHTV